MKKVLIILVLGFLVLIGGTVGVGLLASTDYAVAKTVTLTAPPETVHQWVGDLKRWPEWIPWTQNDPTVEVTYGDQTTGVGAHQSWTSKDGDGELTFTQSDPKTGIAYDMAFIMEGTRLPCSSKMSYEAVDGGTKVTWTMEGDMAGAGMRIVSGWLAITMPSLISRDFEQGLANLQTAIDKTAIDKTAIDKTAIDKNAAGK